MGFVTSILYCSIDFVREGIKYSASVTGVDDANLYAIICWQVC